MAGWWVFPEFPRILFQGHFLPCSLRGSLPLSQGPDHQGGRPRGSAQGGSSGLFKYRGPSPGSAAPPAGLRGWLPQFDGSTVSIFMGVQGWNLATCKEGRPRVSCCSQLTPVQMGACSRTPRSRAQPAGCNQVEGLPLPVSPYHATPRPGLCDVKHRR